MRAVAELQARHGNRYACVPAPALKRLIDAYDARGDAMKLVVEKLERLQLLGGAKP